MPVKDSGSTTKSPQPSTPASSEWGHRGLERVEPPSKEDEQISAGPFCDFQGQEGDQNSLDHHSHTSKGWQGCSSENPARRLRERQLNSCVTIDKSHSHWAPVLT